jgi:ACS family glucarate transporter-like MFS transporter
MASTPAAAQNRLDIGIGCQRYLMAALTAGGKAISYLDRSALGVALPFMQGYFHFSDAMKGVVLAAFFWSYGLAQVPSGWLIDRLGVRLIYPLALVWWSLGTAATGLVRTANALLGARLAFGLGEAPSVPADTKVISHWFPRHERAFAFALVDTGQFAGTALAFPLVVALCYSFGWRAAFLILAAIGILWTGLWLFVYRSPRLYRWISARELEYIETHGAHLDERAGAPRPTSTAALKWKDLFRYRTVWGLFFAYICRSFVLYFFITWFPTYLYDAHHLTKARLGIFGALPALFSVGASWGGGLLSDHLVARGLGMGLARKIPLAGGLLLASTIAIAGVSHSLTLAILCMVLSNCSLALGSGAALSLPADVAPSSESVASISGIQNFGSQLGGVVSPIVIGALLAFNHGSFALPLAVSGAVSALGALLYAVVVKVEPLGGRRGRY